MRTLTAFVLLLLAAGAAVGGSNIDSAHDAGVDYSRYKTFDWKTGRPSIRPELQERIVTAVHVQLAEVGLRYSNQAPDVYVSTYLLVDKHTLAALANRSTWEFYTGMTSTDAYEVAAGTLVIDVTDAASNRVVWRGLIAGDVTGSVAKNEARIDKALRKLFRRYPTSP